MKTGIWFFVFVSLLSCKVLNELDFKDKTFTHNAHMIGNMTIMFGEDSLYTLYERGYSMYNKGIWSLTEDGKKILLRPFSHEDLGIGMLTDQDTAIYIVPNVKEITVKSKKKISYRDRPYTLTR